MIFIVTTYIGLADIIFDEIHRFVMTSINNDGRMLILRLRIIIYSGS